MVALERMRAWVRRIRNLPKAVARIRNVKDALLARLDSLHRQNAYLVAECQGLRSENATLAAEIRAVRGLQLPLLQAAIHLVEGQQRQHEDLESHQGRMLAQLSFVEQRLDTLSRQRTLEHERAATQTSPENLMRGHPDVVAWRN